MYMKGLKREKLTLAAPVKRAKPMTTEILGKLIDYLRAAPRGLRIWRTVWRMNLAFYCLLRWDDVQRLEVCFPNVINVLLLSLIHAIFPLGV
jgi:hypothetical protein